MKNYGKALKMLRKNASMTQAWLAAQLNVTYQTVSKWENGVNTPDISVIEDICKLFGVSVEEFLRLAENVPDGAISDPSHTLAADELAAVPPPEQSARAAAHEDSVALDAAAEKGSASLAPSAQFVQPVAPVYYAPAPTAKPKKTNPDMPFIIVAIVLGAVIAMSAVIVPIVWFVAARNAEMRDAFWFVNARAAMFTVEVEKAGQNSNSIGFFIDKNGNAVVGYSTIDGIKSAEIRTAGGTRYDIDRIVGIDSVRDIALVHVNMPTQSIPITFCKTSTLKSSDRLYAVGKDNIINSGADLASCANNDLRYIEDGLSYIKTTGITNNHNILINRRGELVGFKAPACDDGNMFVRAEDVRAIDRNVQLVVSAFSQNAMLRASVMYMAGEDVLYDLNIFTVEKVPQLQLTPDDMNIVGWYADKDLTTPFDFSKASGKTQIYVYAKTQQPNCKIMFDGGEGSGSMFPLLSGVNDKFIMPDCDFTRTGYKFGGWSYGGKTYGAGEEFTVPDRASISVQAVWSPIKYTVKYTYEDESREATFTYDAKNKLSDKLHERKGYYQVGWTIGGNTYDWWDDVGNLTATDGAVIVATPTWRPISYTMLIDPNRANDYLGSWVSGLPTSAGGNVYVYCEYGTDPLASIRPTAGDYVFDGWEVYDTGGNLYTGDLRYVCAEQDAIINVKVKWRSGRYDLALLRDNKGYYYGQTMLTVTLNGKQEYTLPSVQSLIDNYSVTIDEGYEFKGWGLWGNGAVTFEDGAIVSDLLMYGVYSTFSGYDGSGVRVSLYMKIELIKYTIEFDGNGGEGYMPGIERERLVYPALPLNTFVKKGYRFVGWKCGELFLEDGECYIGDLTTEPNGVVTLVAQWEELTDGDDESDNGGEE